MPVPLLSATNLAKFYGTRLIFKNCDLNLNPGSITLITGPNGAGKSTLLKILAGFIKPDKGDIKFQPNINYAFLGHRTFLYSHLTAYENLDFWVKINQEKTDNNSKLAKKDRQDRIMQILKKMGLENHAHNLTRFFSSGMAQKLNFARIILIAPKVVLLDEPFTGLDLDSQSLIKDEIIHLKANGAAIALVTHNIKEDAAFGDFVLKYQNQSFQESGIKAI